MELSGAYAPAMVIKETEPSLLKVGGSYMAPGQSIIMKLSGMCRNTIEKRRLYDKYHGRWIAYIPDTCILKSL
jgi:hypothetical protein